MGMKPSKQISTHNGAEHLVEFSRKYKITIIIFIV